MLNVELQSGAAGQLQLLLEGRSANPHWVAWLESGLSELQVRMLAADVRRSQSVQWNASFVLDFRDSRFAPENIDYVRLVSKEAPLSPHGPKLSRSLSLRKADGSIELRCEAPPAPGVIGRLLHRLAGLALFPAEIQLSQTPRGDQKYRMLLRGIAGSAPLVSAHQQLGKALQSID